MPKIYKKYIPSLNTIFENTNNVSKITNKSYLIIYFLLLCAIVFAIVYFYTKSKSETFNDK